MGLRVAYREQVLHETDAQLNEAIDRYQSSWHHVVRHAAVIRQVSDLIGSGQIDAGAMLWNAIDQTATDSAFRVILCEREPHDRKNLVTHVWAEFGLTADPFHPEDGFERARPGTGTDNNAAWSRSAHGRCNGCGVLTISDAQRKKLHSVMKAHADLFDLTPTYVQANGKEAELWPIVTIAAKGVAEHVIPRSQGGATDAGNLTNACAYCNYARGDTPLSLMGAPAYIRPTDEQQAACSV